MILILIYQKRWNYINWCLFFSPSRKNRVRQPWGAYLPTTSMGKISSLIRGDFVWGIHLIPMNLRKKYDSCAHSKTVLQRRQNASIIDRLVQHTVISRHGFYLMNKLDSGQLQKTLWSMYIFKHCSFTVTGFIDLLDGTDKSAKQDNQLGVIIFLSLTRFWLN